MMLNNKIAVIYGAGGAIGGAAAKAFAQEGARVFLTGRDLIKVEAIQSDIVAAGGKAEPAEVDALDEQSVDGHLNSVIEKAGRIDMSFNAIALPDAKLLGVPLVELDAELFELAAGYLKSYFLTARLAARRMLPNRSGVIMTVTALHSRIGIPPGRRLRPGAVREGVAHPKHVRRAGAPWHSGSRFTAASHAGDTDNQACLGTSRQGIGNDLGTVASHARKQDSPTAAYDACGDG
jgi:NAD(P)-dependent dehydrogenase (short-subunit alcohol dehydrogenase family)